MRGHGRDRRSDLSHTPSERRFPGDHRGDARRVVRIGCSGWNYPHWRGPIYPAAAPEERWLELYARWFDTVEVNASFYRLPTRKAVERWAGATPAAFCFALKASRYLTHVKRLRELPPGIERLAERIEPLREAGKLGPILWQLPPHFRRDDERLARALDALPPGRHAFEFRDETWFADRVYDLLRAHDIALVVADRAPGRPTPWLETVGWSYLRFHRGRARGGRYGRQALRTWATRIESARGDVYAYFNNDWEGFAVANAKTLRRLVRG
jgi:uncharacterized protein YecE (DUF72 family)